MIYLFIFIDVTSALFGVSLGVLTGERLADELIPNLPILALSFLVIRSLLYGVLFRSVINRDISWVRNIFQSLFLIILLSILTYILVALPSFFVEPENKALSFLLFFASLNGSIYYFVVLPISTLALSLLIHKTYKIEPW